MFKFGWGRTKQTKDVTEMLEKPLEHLHIRENALSMAISQQLSIAQRCANANNVQGAKIALQRKRIHENTLFHIQQQIIRLEQQQLAIDNAETNAQTFQALKQSVGLMKHVKKQEKLNTAGVDDLMDTICEQMEDSADIATAFGQTSTRMEVDVDDELNELFQTTTLEPSEPVRVQQPNPT